MHTYGHDNLSLCWVLQCVEIERWMPISHNCNNWDLGTSNQARSQVKRWVFTDTHNKSCAHPPKAFTIQYSSAAFTASWVLSFRWKADIIIPNCREEKDSQSTPDIEEPCRQHNQGHHHRNWWKHHRPNHPSLQLDLHRPHHPRLPPCKTYTMKSRPRWHNNLITLTIQRSRVDWVTQLHHVLVRVLRRPCPTHDLRRLHPCRRWQKLHLHLRRRHQGWQRWS